MALPGAAMTRILPACIVVAACASSCAAAAADSVGRPVPPDVFTGLGLADFEGEGSIAAALRQARGQGVVDAADEMVFEFRGITVQGPNRADILSPIAAEVRSRIDRIDLAAGLLATQDGIAEGPSQWVGRIGLSNERPEGRERLELRTTLGSRETGGLLGLEIGPRLERRLRRGATFFIDGKAEAQAARSPETGWWAMPGIGADATGAVGVAARTGLVR